MDNAEAKLAEFQMLRKQIYEEFQAKYLASNITVGDFTYGIPIVKSWEEGTHLYIGKFCSLAPAVTILLGGNHRTDWHTTYPFNAFMPLNFSNIKGHPQSKGDIHIGNDVWIGESAKILSGVRIGDGSVVAAASVVAKDVEPYCVVGGVPAKPIRYRFDRDTIRKLLEMQWWNWEDAEILAAIPLLQSGNTDLLWEFYNTAIKRMPMGERGNV